MSLVRFRPSLQRDPSRDKDANVLSRIGAWFNRPIVWTAPEPAEAADSLPPERRAAASEGQRLRRAHDELTALLDRHADSRRTLRHLALLEKLLGRHGKRLFEKEAPVELFDKALLQLETLMGREDGEGLRLLCRRLERVLRARGAGDRLREASGVTVSEASHSLFDEMERSWTGVMPGPPLDRTPR